ncbi:MAG: hypothetical protein JRN19_02755 [Nitrososphaerota archaeon]|nr:hypothetical protein [Nitrososphaerota archaeon]MDG7051355.1 hypothetical protein [Nitrososphaerota archaeon]
MYITNGSGIRSENDVFEIAVLAKTDVEMDSVRLERHHYYSAPICAGKLG